MYEKHCADVVGPLKQHTATTYGITCNSILNTLKFFHVVDGIIPDIMHDILEGTLQLHIKWLLRRFLQAKVIIIIIIIIIKQLASEVGLTLNRSKSEVICRSNSQSGEVMSLFPEIKVIGLDNAQLLGVPIGNIISIDSSLTSKVEKLNLLGSRLGLLYHQDTLLLIRNSLAIPKLVYTLRTAPCFVSQSLGNFDISFRALQ